MFHPDEFGLEVVIAAAEKVSEGQATESERAAAIDASERGSALAYNAWNDLVAAAAATLHPVPVEAAGLDLEHLENFNLEILSRTDHALGRTLLRCIFGNPFRPVAFAPAWRTETAVALASAIYAERAFDRLPILADALEEGGCDHADVLSHCRGPGPHARGCWVVDTVLGKT